MCNRMQHPKVKMTAIHKSSYIEEDCSAKNHTISQVTAEILHSKNLENCFHKRNSDMKIKV
jgi:hypothetical protein